MNFMNDIATFYNGVDSVNNVVVNDSISCEYGAVEQNIFKDFKFVAEQSSKFEGPILRDVTHISATWNFVVLLVIMILMVLNKFLSNQRMSSVISMPFHNGGDRAMRDTQTFFSPMSLSSIISFILIISLLVQKIFVIYGGNRILHDNLGFYVDVVICVAAVLVFNYILTFFYGWMFKTDTFWHFHFSFYVSSMASCNLLLMPVILLLLFHPYKFFLLFALIITAVFFIIAFAKLLIEVRMLSKLNFVNIFLYLCTIEILPILVMSKMIMIIL